MTNDIKVGDVVAWANVPDGALVRDEEGDFACRQHGWCRTVCDQSEWVSWSPAVVWSAALDQGLVTIIALNVPTNTTADDLRALAERFEVREALSHLAPTPPWYDVMWDASERAERDGMVCEDDNCRGALTCSTLLGELANRLHRAGWRKGMTAEDAARLLREAGAP